MKIMEVLSMKKCMLVILALILSISVSAFDKEDWNTDNGPMILSRYDLQKNFSEEDYQEVKSGDVVFFKPRLKVGEVKELCPGFKVTLVRHLSNGKPTLVWADRIYVRFKGQDSISYEKANALLKTLGARILPQYRVSDETAFSVFVPDGETVESLTAKLNKLSEVEYAEPYQVYYTHYTPTDPNYSSQWHHPLVQMPDAWNITFGDPGTVFEINDSGFSLYTLAGDAYIKTGSSYVVSNELQHIAADRATYEHNPGPNRDLTRGDNYPNDEFGHGTDISNLIFADMNDGQYGCGVAPELKILPVKSGSCDGLIYSGNAGIDFGRTNGAKVVNCSYGGHTADSTSRTTVNNAWLAGMIVAASTGNEGDTTDWTVGFPGGYINALAAGATTSTGGRASFSCYGWGVTAGFQNTEEGETFCVAPGSSLYNLQMQYSTYSGGAYLCATADPTNQTWSGSTTGTSFSSPILGALAALMYSLGASDPATIRDIIANTCDHTSNGRVSPTATSSISGANTYSEQYGHGMVQFADALNQVTPAPYLVYLSKTFSDATGGDNDGIPEPGEAVQITVSLQNTGKVGDSNSTATNISATFSTADYYAMVSESASAFSDIIGGGTGAASDPFTLEISAFCPNLHDIEISMYITAKYSSGTKDYSATRTFKLTCGSTPVIIVDVDSGAAVNGYQINSEERLGYSLSALNWTYEIVNSAPADLAYPRFNTVFVCLGNWGYYSSARSSSGDFQVMTSEETNALKNFVDTGGMLYMEGAGEAQRYGGTALWTHFGTNYTGDTTRDYYTGNITTVTGIAATVGARVTATTAYENNATNPGWGAYTDSFNTPLTVTSATSAVTSAGPQGNGLARVAQRDVTNPAGKTIWSDILFSGIATTVASSTVRNNYMDDILDFFGQSTNPTDTTPPADTELSITLNKFVGGKGTIYWTAPGDDEMNGWLANANPYTMRYVLDNAAPYTIDFASATDLTGEPAAAAYPGLAQSMAISLTAGNTYVFMLRTGDEANNYSYSEALVKYLPIAPCGDYTGKLWLLAIWPESNWYPEMGYYQAALDANSIVFDLAVNNLPGDLSGYDVIINVAGCWASWDSDGYEKVGTAGSSEQTALNDFIVNQGKSAAFNFGWNSIFWDQFDYAWINTIAGPGLDGDYTDDYQDRAWTYTKVGGTYGTANYGTYDRNYGEYYDDACDYATAPLGTVAYTDGTTKNNYRKIVEKVSGSSRRLYASMSLGGWTTPANRNTVILDHRNFFDPTYTPPADTCRPNPIDDLTAALHPTAGSVWLFWTAPGDDWRVEGGTGKCVSYAVKRSANPIRVDDAPYTTTTTNFNAAATPGGTVPTPSYAGTAEKMLTTGSTTGAGYYFNIRAADEGPRYSYSNDAYIYLPSSMASPKILVLDTSQPGMTTWGAQMGIYEGWPLDNGIPGDMRAMPTVRALQNLGFTAAYIQDSTANRVASAALLGSLSNYDIFFYFGFTWDPTDRLPSADDTNIYNFINTSGKRMFIEDNYGYMYYGYGEEDLDVGGNEEEIWWDSMSADWYGYSPGGNTGGIKALYGTDFQGIAKSMKFLYNNQSSADHNCSYVEPRNTAEAGPVLRVAEIASRYTTTVAIDDTFVVARYAPGVNIKTMTSGLYIGSCTPYDDSIFAGSTFTNLIKNIMTFFGFGGNVALSGNNPYLAPIWSADGNDAFYIYSYYGSAPALYRANDIAWGEYNSTYKFTRVDTTLHHGSNITTDGTYIYYGRYNATETGLEIYRVPCADNVNPAAYYPHGILGGATPDVIRWYDPDFAPAAAFSDNKGRLVACHAGELVSYISYGWTPSNATTLDAIRITRFQADIEDDDTIEPKCYQPRWSPDGDSVVFVYRPPVSSGVSKSGVYVINGVKDIIAAGSVPVSDDIWVKSLADTRVYTCYAITRHPAWSPSFSQDGSLVAFSVDILDQFNNKTFLTTPLSQLENSNFEVYMKEWEDRTSFESTLLTTDNNEAFVQWAPEGGNKLLQGTNEKTSKLYTLAAFSDTNNEIGGWASKADGTYGTEIRDYANTSLRIKGEISEYGIDTIKILPTGTDPNIPEGYKYYGASRKITSVPASQDIINGGELKLHYVKKAMVGHNADKYRLGLFFLDNGKLREIDATFTENDLSGWAFAKIEKYGDYYILGIPKAAAVTDLSKVRVFPNPCRVGAVDGTVNVEGVVIDTLPDNVTEVNIYNIAGEKVATMGNAVEFKDTDTALSTCPTDYIDTWDVLNAKAYWNGKNDDGESVAHGVYVIVMKLADGKTVYKKVAVIK